MNLVNRHKTKSNDKSELQLMYGLVKDVFIEEFCNDKPKYINKHFPLDDFKKFLDINTYGINPSEQSLCTQFVICFSDNGDMLSHWRGYGDDGKGVSIEI